MLALAVVFALSYLTGSFPSAWIACRLVGGGEIRQRGSGNAGATNVLRELGWKVALPVFLVDAAKGAASVILAMALVPMLEGMPTLPGMVATLGSMLGHAFPPWLGFRGGKAVATGAACVAVLVPWVALACLAVFAITFAAGRYVSLASMAAAIAMLPAYFVVVRIEGHAVDLALAAFLGMATLLVIILHRGNIGRLSRGEEKRL